MENRREGGGYGTKIQGTSDENALEIHGEG